MSLVLHRINFYNEGRDGANYQLLVKDGDEVLARSPVTPPTQHGSIPAVQISLESPLTLIAEKV